jgi:hypothetical protein
MNIYVDEYDIYTQYYITPLLAPYYTLITPGMNIYADEYDTDDPAHEHSFIYVHIYIYIYVYI